MAARPVRGASARSWPGGRVLPPARAVRRPREQVSELQRARLVAAAVAVVDERGYTRATVAHVTARARVSRRTFYDLYGDLEECLGAVVEGAVEQVCRELAEAGLEGLAWRERVRAGLWVVLSFLDREPALARVCVVQALRAGPAVLEYRERVLSRLARVVDEGRREGSRAAECSALTAEGVVGAAAAIVYRRLWRRERAPLTGLLGELVGMVVLPYLGTAAARREQARPVSASARARVAGASGGARGGAPPRGGEDPLQGVSMRLTYRTARVLEAVAGWDTSAPGPSNRQIAQGAGVTDPGQISKLLARLERLGLLANRGAGAHAQGEPNAWALTATGRRLAQSIRLHDRSEAA